MQTSHIVNNRTLCLIDGANLDWQRRELGIHLDLRRLVRWVAQFGPFEIHWFQAEHSGTAPFLDAVRAAGIVVHTMPARRDRSGRMRGNMDTHLVAVGMEALAAGGVGTLVLVSGDRDFRPLLERASIKGVRVIVVSLTQFLAGELADLCQPRDVIDLRVLTAFAGLPLEAA